MPVKLVKNVAGQLTEEVTVATSAGAGSAAKIPELNGSGILDDSILNAATTGSNKVLKLDGSGKVTTSTLNAVTTSAGSGDTGKVVLLDGSGRIDTTVLPVGTGADTASITTSEALSAGDFVNIWNSTGAKARKADASSAGKEAMGFVLSAVSSGAQATVYFEGTNTAVTTQTPGKVYLDPANPGKSIATAPTTTGQVLQVVGFATSATSVNFQYNQSIVLG